jgi:serine/threonine-protein kinase RsbW
MYKKIVIKARVENLRIVEKEVDDTCSKVGIGKENYGNILVAAMEAVNNAIVHGNKGDESKEVIIEILVEDKIMKISVEDQGPGFNPSIIPDPTKPENLEKISGRGVFLMTRLADKIEFNEKGNKVTMSFNGI